MRGKITRPLFLWLFAFVLLIISCGPTPETLPAAPTTPPTAQALNTTITGVQHTTTSQPPVIAPTIPVSTLARKTWDLLIISDSTNGKVGPYYARLIEADQNVKVNLHNCWVSGLQASEILKNLQDNTYSEPEVEEEKTCYQPWANLVLEAEVIVLFGNPGGSLPPDGAWNVPESFAPACFVGVFEEKTSDIAAYKQKMLQSCAPETFATYKAHLNAILDEIANIRNGKPVILRMTDYYIPVHTQYKMAGVDDSCTTCMWNFSSTIRQVEKERGVPDFSTMDALNGPDHLQDPNQNGYIGEDGGHLSDAGAQFVAKLLQQSGYKAWQPTISSK